MIGRLRGIILEKQAPSLVLEVNGVGYELQAPMSTFYQLPDIGKETVLFTHFVVREDAQLLYGFVKREERTLFRALIKVSGVGPKLALTILSGIDPDTFVRCIQDGDVSTLQNLPGIGNKTAERLLVEMRNRLKDWQIESQTGGVATVGNAAVKDALSALLALGYKPQEANRAVAKHKDKNLTSEELIRVALQDMAAG
ncbi:MAG: Holliday junction branch migration protein RuvA [Gammaproteobacteria bacterium]|nr:Holliday junction branch migration protein RuvA [Gammaproteobacteria bacterium]